MRRKGSRTGFSLVDVALATLIISVGTLGASRFFTSVYSDLSPQANGGGLRRFIISESMLKAEAEALRAAQFPWNTSPECVYVTVPSYAGFTFSVSVPQTVSTSVLQYNFYDMSVTDQGSTIGQLSVSTLRAFSGGVDGKPGL